MSDLISRQAAIKATWQDTGYTDPFNVMTAIRDRIKQLPPIQPEIIRCKDCKHWIFDGVMVCERFTDASLKGDDFCSYGERI